jgi:hypothetical protein
MARLNYNTKVSLNRMRLYCVVFEEGEVGGEVGWFEGDKIFVDVVVGGGIFRWTGDDVSFAI